MDREARCMNSVEVRKVDGSGGKSKVWSLLFAGVEWREGAKGLSLL